MKFVFLFTLFLFSSSLVAGEPVTLDEKLEPLRPFVGKTWRGEFKGGDAEKKTIDVSRWERALNGKAIKIVHSINDGMYGGETIVRWDPEKKQITYFYFSTAGFYTTGTMTRIEKKIVCNEMVSGGAAGTTEVRSTYELRDDGTLLNKAEYLKGQEVTGSREVLYKEAPGAEVRFR